MHLTAAVFFFSMLVSARPSQQRPPSVHLQRTTGCTCSTGTSKQHHTFWLEPQQSENPGDTCQWLAWRLSHRLHDTDPEAAGQQQAVSAEWSRGLAEHDIDGLGEDDATAAKDEVRCAIEGMREYRDDDGMLSDLVVAKVFLGAAVLLVVAESVSTRWR